MVTKPKRAATEPILPGKYVAPPPDGGWAAATAAVNAQMVRAKAHGLSVMDMRLEGMSMERISIVVGMSVEGVYAAYREAIAKRAAENYEGEVAHLRQLEADRMDALLSAVWPKAIGGDLYAVYAALRIAERRAKLFGLDAPVKTEDVTPGGGKVPLALIDDLMRAYDAQRASGATAVVS